MIERLIDFSCIDGAESPLLPLLFVDYKFTAAEFGGTFIQKDEKDNILCAFSVKNGCANFCGMQNAATEEITEFFRFLKIKTVTSDSLLPMFRNCGEYNLMVLSQQQQINGEYRILTNASSLTDYKTVFDIFADNDNCFENWFTDFSKKINSGNAFAVYCTHNGKAVSAAVAPAAYGKNAVIAGVFTLKEYRKKGFGSLCLNKLTKLLCDNGFENICLWCNDSKVSFYEKNRFECKTKVFIGEC